MRGYGSIQKKIMLALLGGVVLGFSSSPRQYFRNLRNICADWKKINQRNFNRSVRRLADEKIVEEQRLADGSFKLVLTEKGKKQASRFNSLSGSIDFKKPKSWDGKWRIVLFDIPEEDRVFRDILRDHLRELGFYKLQHSVFISPYPFEKPILELVALYSAGPFVRVVTAIKIDNEAKIKRHFSLSI